jgi:predicted N-formylglutamate amidohydrolase
MSIRIIPGRLRAGQSCNRRASASANVTQIKEAVDATQQMIVGNVILQAEVVEQPLRCCLRPHHQQIPVVTREAHSALSRALTVGPL